jgi:hypothetical protein
MPAVASFPKVYMTWEVRVAGRVLGGSVTLPDCEQALELVTRSLVGTLIGHHDLTRADFRRGHVFIFRRGA